MKVQLLVLALIAGGINAQEEFSCVGKEEGRFYSDPDSCPGWFQCVDEIVTSGACPVPYQFFEEEQHCSYAVGECKGYYNVTTLAPGTTTSTPIVGEYDCREDDVHHLPHVSSCTSYILCYKGEPTQMECPDGLWFNPTKLTCMDEAVSECLENPCPAEDPEKPLYVPNKNDCAMYYICMNGQPKDFTCAEGYIFDPTVGQCNKPENVEDQSHCSNTNAPVTPTTTTGPTTESTTTESTTTDGSSTTEISTTQDPTTESSTTPGTSTSEDF